MFKKIASIALAAMLIGSTAVMASAAENEDAVAAADGSAVAANDDSAVAANDDSAVAANDDSGSTGDGQKIYFDPSGFGWNNYKSIMLYLYEKGGSPLIQWQSKKGKMDEAEGGKYSFDMSAYPLDAGKQYACIFVADTGVQTCDLMIGPECYSGSGDTAVATGKKIENTEDSNKQSDGVAWTQNAGKYGVPKAITSIGNIVGDVYWPGEDAKSLLTTFLTSDDAKKNINNALKFNGKDTQKTIDDTAKELGLTWEETKQIVEECKGKNPDIDLTKWDPEKSSLKSSSGSGSGSGSGSSSSGSSGSSSSGSSSSGSSGSSSSSGSSDSTSTVTSGEGTTVYFIIGGLMLAAVGVFFLARKRREF